MGTASCGPRGSPPFRERSRGFGGRGSRARGGGAGPVPREPGGTVEVRVDGEVLGVGLRSGRSRRMIYVSVGHAISLGTAVRITKTLCRTRIPEPLRRAHILATDEKRK